MPGEWMDDRRDRIADRLVAGGYRVVRSGDDELVMHRRRIALSAFGFLDSVAVIACHEGSASRADLLDREEGAVREALLLKIGLPRGLFSAVEVFPITLVDDADGEAVEFVCNSVRNRWAVLSMPAVVHDGGREVATFTGHKLWGGAYVSSMRRRVLGWVGDPDG